MNIVKLREDNVPGIKNILVLDVSRVVSGGERPVGINVNTPICHYADSPAVYVEGIRGTIQFNDKEIKVEGATMYEQTMSCIIPKDRPDIMNQFFGWREKRFICLGRDKNNYIKMLGTRPEPASFFINERSSGADFDERNEIQIGFTVTRRHPAYNYTVQTQAVESAGVITIGNRVFS